MDLVDPAEQFSDGEKTREFLETQRQTEGPLWAHCGVVMQLQGLKPVCPSGFRRRLPRTLAREAKVVVHIS